MFFHIISLLCLAFCHTTVCVCSWLNRVIPVHLMYRPANTIPHATVESDLKGVYLRYCLMDATGRLVMRTGSEAALKCCTLQHWILQWTNGNLLLTRMEGTVSIVSDD